MPKPTKQELESQANRLAQSLEDLYIKASQAKDALTPDSPIRPKEMLKAEIQILKLQLAEIEAQIQNKAR